MMNGHVQQPTEHVVYEEDQVVELARLAYVAANSHGAPNWAMDLMVGGLDVYELRQAASAWREFSFEPPGFADQVERLADAVEGSDADDGRLITLFAQESHAEQAARLHALKADPETTYFAGDDHDRPDLPGWPLPADVWVWSVGGTWVATVAGFHADDWWEGSDPEAWDEAPHRWYRPISDVPTTGTLSYYTRDGKNVTKEVRHGT